MNDIQDSRFPDDVDGVEHENPSVFGADDTLNGNDAPPATSPRSAKLSTGQEGQSGKKPFFDPVMIGIVTAFIGLGGAGAYMLFHHAAPAESSAPVTPLQPAQPAAPMLQPGAVPNPPTGQQPGTPAARGLGSANPALGQASPPPAAGTSSFLAGQQMTGQPPQPGGAPQIPTTTPGPAQPLPTPVAPQISATPSMLGSPQTAVTPPSEPQQGTPDTPRKIARLEAQIAALKAQNQALQSHEGQPHASSMRAEPPEQAVRAARPHQERQRVARRTFVGDPAHWVLLGVVDQTAVIRLPNGAIRNGQAGQWIDGVKIEVVDATQIRTSRGIVRLR